MKSNTNPAQPLIEVKLLTDMSRRRRTGRRRKRKRTSGTKKRFFYGFRQSYYTPIITFIPHCSRRGTRSIQATIGEDPRLELKPEETGKTSGHIIWQRSKPQRVSKILLFNLRDSNLEFRKRISVVGYSEDLKWKRRSRSTLPPNPGIYCDPKSIWQCFSEENSLI